MTNTIEALTTTIESALRAGYDKARFTLAIHNFHNEAIRTGRADWSDVFGEGADLEAWAAQLADSRHYGPILRHYHAI